MTREEEPGRSALIEPFVEWRKTVPFAPVASSDRLGWRGMIASRYCAAPSSELQQPALDYHALVLFTRPSEKLIVSAGGMTRHTPPPAGSVMLLPAGSPVAWQWSGSKDSLHIHLDAALVAQVAAEAFDLDPARVSMPPLDSLELSPLRATMLAVNDELTTGGAGGRLAAESLANLLSVQLIRHVLAPRPAPGADCALPRVRLRAVVEYIEENLATGPTLEQMAAVVRLSPFHFARQFKAAVGIPPHQYVITRRVERVKQLLQTETDQSLAEMAASTGFSDQSQLCHHFKHLIGVTPGQFRKAARNA